MEERIRRVLIDVEQFGREHDARETDHARRMLNLEPETAALVSILARSFHAHSVLEIGTSNGSARYGLPGRSLLVTAE